MSDIDVKQVIVVNTSLNMRKGKLAAQVAHASMAAILNQAIWEEGKLTLEYDKIVGKWLEGSFKKIVLGVESEDDLVKVYRLAGEKQIIRSLITDAGLTEFHGVPTMTTVAIGPAEASIIDVITGTLGLVKTKLI